MTSTALRMQHTSLQHSDTPRQQNHDIRLIFERGVSYPIKTGTEALRDPSGANMNHALLVDYAEKYDHMINFSADNWVAVDRRIMVRGSHELSDLFLVDNAQMRSGGADRKSPVISFDHVNPLVGRIHVAATHYPTKGAEVGDPNFEVNVLMAEKLAKWAYDVARGPDLAFINGDFNANDVRVDWAYGGKFTSMADELDAHQNTGHGPIDGFCSYDKDRRVTAKRFTVLDDAELRLFTDHFLCRGVWDVEHLSS